MPFETPQNNGWTLRPTVQRTLVAGVESGLQQTFGQCWRLARSATCSDTLYRSVA